MRRDVHAPHSPFVMVPASALPVPLEVFEHTLVLPGRGLEHLIVARVELELVGHPTRKPVNRMDRDGGPVVVGHGAQVHDVSSAQVQGRVPTKARDGVRVRPLVVVMVDQSLADLEVEALRFRTRRSPSCRLDSMPGYQSSPANSRIVSQTSSAGLSIVDLHQRRGHIDSLGGSD